jgi:hypothetical protein
MQLEETCIRQVASAGLEADTVVDRTRAVYRWPDTLKRIPNLVFLGDDMFVLRKSSHLTWVVCT